MEKNLNIEVFSEDHLPIIKTMADRIGLVKVINRIVESEMTVSPGIYVLAMVLDTLSGRSPIYHLERFFKSRDRELLLGENISSKSFEDSNVGRAMDKIFEAGTNRLFTEVAISAMKTCPIAIDRISHDTTSINVYGDYPYNEKEDDPFWITNGYSKDHRPDLKQFVFSMLCCGGDIPILGQIEDGNASDKTVNTRILKKVSEYMKRFGANPKSYIYVADSAMVTEDNLRATKDTYFVSRLPATYCEHDRVIREAVESDQWIELGRLAESKPTRNRPVASYKVQEKSVVLYEKEYRAIVVHSTGHDKRRSKKLDKEINSSLKEARMLEKQAGKLKFHCRPDAENEAIRITQGFRGKYHYCNVHVECVIKYARGRIPVNGQRKVTGEEFILKVDITENQEAISFKKEESGCFVLISNAPSTGKLSFDAKGLLTTYKEQYGIEKNFGFLKDDAIVNAIFLKTPQRIEVLGLVLLISLLLWRLIKKSMRENLRRRDETVTGWNNRPTSKPTGYMLMWTFKEVLVIKLDGKRRFTHRLSQAQHEFLKALDMSSDIFIKPRYG